MANLEFLLLNHPLDCPICDRGGECPLQDQALAFGPGESRYREAKRTYRSRCRCPPLVNLDRERCVLCARCTRFCDQISGDRFIELFAAERPSRCRSRRARTSVRRSAGNTVQICPVGALTSTRTGSSRVRSTSRRSTRCARTAARLQHEARHAPRRGRAPARSRQLRRERRLALRQGRYAFRFPDAPDRIATPLIRDHGLEPASFGEVLDPGRWLDRGQARRDPHRRAADGRGLLRAVEARPHGLPNQRPRPPAGGGVPRRPPPSATRPRTRWR